MGKLRLLPVILFFTLIAQAVSAGDRLDGPVGFIESPASRATGGLFGTDSDDYLNSARYKDIDMIKEIIVVSFQDADFATFGYGRYFGKLYAAVYYGGNLFRGFFNDSYITSDETINGKKISFKDYGSVPVINDPGNNNRFAFLAGFGNTAFRLSWASTLGRFNGKDIAFNDEGTQLFYKSYANAIGWIIPELQWGLTVPLTGRGIRPLVSFELGMKREFMRYKLYDTGAYPAEQGEVVENSMNHVQPRLSVGLGSFTVFSKPAFDTTIDLEYSLCLRFYNNDYNYIDSSGIHRIASIKGLNNKGALTENGYAENIFTPSVGVSYSGMPRLDFKAGFYFPLLIVSGKETGMELVPGKFKGELQKKGDETSLTAFQFSPVLKIAFQYQAVPEKLDLNIGGIMQFASVTKASCGSISYTGYGEWNSGMFPGMDPVTGTNQSSCLYAGFTFMFNEKVLLDAMTGLNTGSVDNDFNIFGVTGRSLTSLSSILLSLKI